ncbi:MAG: NAD(P)H-dependent oxidoreductase [Psittacicella sp.]
MKKVLILNTHLKFDGFAKGELAQEIVNIANTTLNSKGYDIKVTNIQEVLTNLDISKELEDHKWADYIIVHLPIYWMNVSSIYREYMDKVYSAGMMGDLCQFDGRHSVSPKENYGTGGLLTNTKYMLVTSLNAPEEAFRKDDFFGKPIDDLLFSQHMVFKFFGMQKLNTFAFYDVLKNFDINQFKDFENHINSIFND